MNRTGQHQTSCFRFCCVAVHEHLIHLFRIIANPLIHLALIIGNALIIDSASDLDVFFRQNVMLHDRLVCRFLRNLYIECITAVIIVGPGIVMVDSGTDFDGRSVIDAALGHVL